MTSKIAKCPKCNGKGYINAYGHVKNGICFKCNGEGTVKVRVKSEAQKTREAAKKSERESKRQKYQDNREAYTKMCMNDPRVWTSPIMKVTPEHPYAFAHAIEVYEYHEKFGWE